MSYASRVLQPHERRYPISHKECLAIIYALDQFRYYLSGVHFFVVTDHHSLCYLMKTKKAVRTTHVLGAHAAGLPVHDQVQAGKDAHRRGRPVTIPDRLD